MKEKGFTLIEVMAAMVLLLTTAIPMLTILTRYQVGQARLREQVAAIAMSQMAYYTSASNEPGYLVQKELETVVNLGKVGSGREEQDKVSIEKIILLDKEEKVLKTMWKLQLP